MTTVSVEVVLKDSTAVKIEEVAVAHGAPDTWTEAAVRDLLIEMLRAIERVHNPGAPRDRTVSLTGFSWIVEPVSGGVMLALQIPMGVAAAGPLAMPQDRLEAMVGGVLKLERGSKTTVH